MTEIIADVEAERALLGTLAMIGETPLAALHQQGLRPEHFYRFENVFRTVLEAANEGPVDAVTVPELRDFLLEYPSLGNFEAYAQRIMDKARWRAVRHAGYHLVDAAEGEDEEGLIRAEQLLVRPEQNNRVFTRGRLQEVMSTRLNAEKVAGWRVPFFDALAVPGTVWLWGGHTSHGKSVWIDQLARVFHEQGARVWSWLNEMTAEERMCRHVAAATGLPLERVQENDLTEEEKADVLRALKVVPFEIVECPGWSAEEIARDIRMRNVDVAFIDILHKIPYETERDLGRISRVLGDAAKLANCVIMATVHLNRGRIAEAARPIPTLSDIKGASSFEQDADVIGFVWREDDETTGRPKENGLVTIAKFRQGKPTGIPVWLQGNVATFRRMNVA